MSVALSDLIVCWDFDRLTSDGKLYEYAHGLHATPGAAGAAPTRTLTGEYTTDGGDYWTVPLDFYLYAPAGAHTWIFRFGSTAIAAAIPRIFSCWNSTAGGVDKGIMLCLDSTAAAQRVRAYQCQGAAAQPYVVSAAAEPYVHGYQSVVAVTVEAAPRGLHNQTIASYSWGAGALGTASYDTAIVPRIGMDPAATNVLTGRGGFLALVKGSLSSPDLAQLCRILVEGSAKPFCQRVT
jgi:hypothetical protein